VLARYGLPGMLPANIQMIHGPGCPVSVFIRPLQGNRKAQAMVDEVFEVRDSFDWLSVSTPNRNVRFPAIDGRVSVRLQMIRANIYLRGPVI